MNYLTKISHFCVRATGKHEFLGVSSQVMLNSRASSDDIRFLDKIDAATMKRGRGGRSSFSGVVATVFGATGFLGKYVCNQLGKVGTQIIIPYRCDFYFVKHLKVVGDLGQVLFLPFELGEEDAIRNAVKHSDVVINLIGRDWETRNFTFDQVHVEASERIARISKEMGVKKFIHVSALNCNMEHKGYIKEGGSGFLRTKGLSEGAVKEYYPDAIIFRPSDMWGQEDRFFNLYCRNFRCNFFKGLPLVNNGVDIWKQPVYVADVARGIVNAVYDHQAIGTTFEATGPRRYELCELIDWFYRVMRKDDEWGYFRFDMKWAPLTKLKVRLNDHHLSNPIITHCTDKIEREAVTDTSFDLPTLEDLGVNLTKMEDRINWELSYFKFHQFYKEEVGEYDDPIPPKFVLP